MLLSLFEAGGSLFGLPAGNTAEVLPHPGTLYPVPGARWGLLGLFTLRDVNIPLVDLPLLCGAKAADDPGSIILVAAHDGHLLGLSVHAIHGLLEISELSMQRHASGQFDAGPRLFDRTFRADGRVGFLLEPSILFGLSGVPSARKPSTEHVERRQAAAVAAPSLFFRAGPLKLAITAAAVDATVPESPIAEGPLTSQLCYGTITYLGRVIPVVDPLVLIGVAPSRSKRAVSAALVLRVPPAGLIALAVDEITGIGAAAEEFPAPLAALGNIDGGLFRSLVRLAGGDQHILLDGPALTSRPQVDSLSRLSFQKLGGDAPQLREDSQSDQGSAEPLHDGESFLFFRSGRRFAVALDQIRHIIEIPSGAICFPAPERGVRGFFTVGNESAVLIELSAMLGLARTGGGAERVLLLDGLPVQIGILVDDLIAIERSILRVMTEGASVQPSISSALPPAAMVPLVTGRGSELIEYIDLKRLASEQILASAPPSLATIPAAAVAH